MGARFNRSGLLALDPAALGVEFERPHTTQARGGDVAVVEIVGPLVHHVDPCFESYDGIKSRVGEALQGPCKCVLLSIDSPGGLVDGCFDCVTELRAMAAGASKPLYVYVDAHAESAAYALATAGDRIFIPPAGSVGSIGVINVLLDTTIADAAMGIQFSVLTSGARKADANPHVAKTEAALASEQLKVDAVAGQFFALVAERRGLSVEAVRGFEARTFLGQAAIDAGLADRIGTFDEVLALLASAETAPGIVPSASLPGSEPKGSEMEEIMKALRALADGEGPEDEKAKALKMLASLEEKSDEEPKAEADEPDGDEPEEKEDEPKPEARAVSAMRAELEARIEAKFETQSLLAARTDLPADTRAALAKLPPAAARSVLKTLPKLASGPVAAARAALDAKPLQAADETPALSASELEILDRAMGLSKPLPEVKREAHRTVFPALNAEQARALLVKRGEK